MKNCEKWFKGMPSGAHDSLNWMMPIANDSYIWTFNSLLEPSSRYSNMIDPKMTFHMKRGISSHQEYKINMLGYFRHGRVNAIIILLWGSWKHKTNTGSNSVSNATGFHFKAPIQNLGTIIQDIYDHGHYQAHKYQWASMCWFELYDTDIDWCTVYGRGL